MFRLTVSDCSFGGLLRSSISILFDCSSMTFLSSISCFSGFVINFEYVLIGFDFLSTTCGMSFEVKYDGWTGCLDFSECLTFAKSSIRMTSLVFSLVESVENKG